MKKRLVTTEKALVDFISTKTSADILAYDTETNGLHHIRDRVVGFSLCDGVESIYVPISHKQGNITGNGTPDEIVIRALAEIAIKQIPLVMHNAVFDISLTYRTFGVVLKCAQDTEAMAYVAGEERHGLKWLTFKYFHYQQTEFKELMANHFGRSWKKDGYGFGDLHPKDALSYAADDGIYTYKLVEPLSKVLVNVKGEGIYRLEMEMIPVIVKLNFTGVPIDTAMLQAASRIFAEQNVEREKAIFQIAGKKFSINSPKDVSAVLFGQFGLPVQKRSKKTGAPSTDAEVLEALENSHPIVPLIARWRIASKLSKTYTEKIPKSVESNGRIYPIFHSIGSVSGRLTSSSALSHDGEKYGMNFQNIALNTFEVNQKVPYIIPQGVIQADCVGKSPKELASLGCRVAASNEEGIPIEVKYDADIRSAFKPSSGMEWLKADFSQIEYRVMASLAGEPALIEGFRQGIDYHSLTASVMLKKPIDEITKEERTLGKVLNFALSYGMAPATLAKRTGMSEAEAEQKYREYFDRVPLLSNFIVGCKEFARNNGYIRTFFGRTRYLPIGEVPPNKVDGVLRKAFNTMIQGTAADILKLVMVLTFRAIDKFGSDCKMTLTVHDELDFEIKPAIFDEAAAVIKQAMEIPVHPSWAPVVVDLERGSSWSPKELETYIVKNPLPAVKFEGWDKIL